MLAISSRGRLVQQRRATCFLSTEASSTRPSRVRWACITVVPCSPLPVARPATRTPLAADLDRNHAAHFHQHGPGDRRFLRRRRPAERAPQERPELAAATGGAAGARIPCGSSAAWSAARRDGAWAVAAPTGWPLPAQAGRARYARASCPAGVRVICCETAPATGKTAARATAARYRGRARGSNPPCPRRPCPCPADPSALEWQHDPCLGTAPYPPDGIGWRSGPAPR